MCGVGEPTNNLPSTISPFPNRLRKKSAPTYVMTTNNQQKNGITNVEKQRSHELTCSCTWGNNNFYDMSPPACQAAIASLVSFGDKTPGL
jgi:hypothetical protein